MALNRQGATTWLQCHLPSNVLSEVERVFAKLGCYIDDSWAVAPLSRGLSNQNYHLVTGNGQFVLRINSQASSQICKRDDEVMNWRLAQTAQLAPELLYVSDDSRFYLSRYIQTQQDWSQLMTANPAHPLIEEHECWPGGEQALLRLLKGLSELPLPAISMSVGEQWHSYYQQLQTIADGPSLPESYQQAWQQRWQALKALSERVDELLLSLDACMVSPQFSHRDLNPHNLLMSGGRLWCIDYEYACSSHPLVDLASVLASHRLSSNQRHSLILGYLSEHPHLNDRAQAAIPNAVALYWVFAACWALLMASQGGACFQGMQTEPDASLPHSVADYLQCFDDFMALIA